MCCTRPVRVMGMIGTSWLVAVQAACFRAGGARTHKSLRERSHSMSRRRTGDHRVIHDAMRSETRSLTVSQTLNAESTRKGTTVHL